jgi:hypothetical protein
MDDGREDGAGRVQVTLDESARELFPNVDNKDNTYRVGFSVNKHLIPSIHIQDKSGDINKKSLNKLIEKMAIIIKEG